MIRRRSERKAFLLDQRTYLMGLTGAKVHHTEKIEGTSTDLESVQKIKSNLIRKAKVKKSYAKLKEREFGDDAKVSTTAPPNEGLELVTLDLHPERQAMLEEPEVTPQPKPSEKFGTQRQRKPKRPKSMPFEREARLAQQRREEAEKRRRAFEDSQAQRQKKIEERERFRRAMAKARTRGKNGQRKLGRESKVLLEKVQRVMSE